MDLLELHSPPDGKKCYVENSGSNMFLLLYTATNTVTSSVNVGIDPGWCGQFIRPAIPTALINEIQATSTITWSKPSDIIYGTKLTATQLDASASVPGTFVYTPPSGTVLSVGTHTLSTTFTPTDIANYTTTSANVAINVVTPTQKINQMITFIQGVTTSGELNDGSSYELIAILNAAETNLDRIESDPSVGNPFAEPAELRYFINQVRDKIDRGVLSQTNGQTLIDAANDIINSLSSQVG